MIERKDDNVDEDFGFEIPDGNKNENQSNQKDDPKETPGLSESMAPLTKTEVEEKGINLDFIQQKRTSDQMRRGFLSKLTYEKIWLTP